ncbi:MAG: hypothetical protein CME25_03560 [Gemmatimonadetes bacterium]|nr:hypothetical protein [Gemmatimonadota bacterium]
MGEVSGPAPDPGVQYRKGTRATLFDAGTGPVETEVLDRYALPIGYHIEGPAIVEETESTTFVGPQWTADVDDSGSLILQKREGGK